MVNVNLDNCHIYFIFLGIADNYYNIYTLSGTHWLYAYSKQFHVQLYAIFPKSKQKTTQPILFFQCLHGSWIHWLSWFIKSHFKQTDKWWTFSLTEFGMIFCWYKNLIIFLLLLHHESRFEFIIDWLNFDEVPSFD